MAPDWQREVDELHQFFQALFLAEIDSIDRAEAALGPDFTMVGPDGTVSQRADVLAQLRSGHGHSAELRIEIEEHRTVVETDAVIVGEYIEFHSFADDGNRRRTTVAFDVDPDGPNGVRWRHAQETWLLESRTGG